MRIFLAAVISAATLGGCATPASKLDMGMTRDQVREKLGKPNHVNQYKCNAHGGRANPMLSCDEYWTYNGFSKRSKIEFKDGVVVGW